MPTRVWTVEQANAALPAVSALVTSVRAAVRRDHERETLAGGDPTLIVRGAADVLAVEGVVLRDLARGLVDFPAVTADGRPYWLCWVLGEPSVTWWHWPEEGFAGRTPLTEPPT